MTTTATRAATKKLIKLCLRAKQKGLMPLANLAWQRAAKQIAAAPVKGVGVIYAEANVEYYDVLILEVGAKRVGIPVPMLGDGLLAQLRQKAKWEDRDYAVFDR